MPPPESFVCPITSELMADPVFTSDGLSYEREAIEQWFRAGNQTSPLTGQGLDSLSLIPNHTLRSAIQEYIDGHPDAAADLYHARAPPKAATVSPPAGAVAPAAEHVPLGLPVTPVQAPPAMPLAPLSDAELAAAAPLAVPDWKAHCAPAKPKASGGWFGFGGSGRAAASSAAAEAEEPKVRAVMADGGGIALEVEIDSPANLLRLAHRLAARGSAPLAALRITAPDGFGGGTANPMRATGEGFELLARALMAGSSGSDALRGLRELSLSKITVGNEAAEALSTVLAGHTALETLELWNVALEDDGARAIARLAARDGIATLRTLNLGRNLLSPESRDDVNAIADGERVLVKLF